MRDQKKQDLYEGWNCMETKLDNLAQIGTRKKQLKQGDLEGHEIDIYEGDVNGCKKKKQMIFLGTLEGHIITGLFGGAIFEAYEGDDSLRQK